MTGLHSPGRSLSGDIHVLWQRRFWLGDAAIVLPDASAALRRQLSRAALSGDVCDVVCGPVDIALYLTHPLVSEETVLSWLTAALAGTSANQADEPRLHRFAVRYGGEATDLEEFAQRQGVSAQEVVALHTGRVYEVASLGFAPGFAYLTETFQDLQLPRKSSPRLSVGSGAVAVAHRYTAIYPRASAAGWWILGYVSAEDARKLWTPGRRFPALFSIADRVAFYDRDGDNNGRDDDWTSG